MLGFTYVMDKGSGKRMRVYGTMACSKCPFFLTKCTADRSGREIHRGLHEELVDETLQRISDLAGKTSNEPSEFQSYPPSLRLSFWICPGVL
jgi:hypothetical protein